MSVSIGVDTGGTYTDAVLFDADRGVVCSAKALTTRHDLAVGIGEAISSVLQSYRGPVSFLSVSTTLATNALAEKSGAPVCIVLLGYPDYAIDHHISEQAFGEDPVVRLDGGHGVEGDEQQPLDIAAVQQVARDYGTRVRAFAVSGYFSVRNPAHEQRARALLSELTGLPVSCGHELSTRLNAGRRALTTAWNARLIPLLSELVAAVRAVMAARQLRCPLMMVKGDGSLVSAEFAQQHAVQTILSGPAASVVGAQYLHGVDNACVVDIGGTTTDIAFIRDRRPVVSADGARVGGMRTMVPAVQMHTFALGGDSAVGLTDSGELTFGPERVVPVSLALSQNPAARAEFEQEAAAARDGALDGGVFLGLSAAYRRAAGRDGALSTAAALSPSQMAIVRAAGDSLAGRARLLCESESVYRADRDIRRLLQRGVLVRSGFTPSDAAHILGRQRTWNRDAAELTAIGLYHRARASGSTLFDVPQDAGDAAIAIAVAERVITRFVSASAGALVAAAICESTGSEVETQSSLARALIDSAVLPACERSSRGALLSPRMALGCPIVAVGAPADCYYRDVAEILETTAVVPEHSEVANAIGAVVGQVRTEVAVRITPLNGGEVFRVHLQTGTEDFESLEAAESCAQQQADSAVRQRARDAGAAEFEVTVQQHRTSGAVAHGEMLIEITVHAAAFGRPQVGALNRGDEEPGGLR